MPAISFKFQTNAPINPNFLLIDLFQDLSGMQCQCQYFNVVPASSLAKLQHMEKLRSRLERSCCTMTGNKIEASAWP
jgi:hypothetical protein